MPDQTELSKYFPTDRAEPCYAVYATAVDRFILVDRHDLSILLRAAMLFSSKMITVVCVYDNKVNPALTDDNCMAWAPVYRVSQAKNRVPTVRYLEGPGSIVEKGPVPFTGADALALARRYLAFTVRVAYAQFMTNAKLGHADIGMFRHMIPEFETLPGAQLSEAPQVFPAQFRDQRIEEILYFADTVEQARSEINKLVAKSPYYTVFNALLDGRAVAVS